MQIIKIPFSLKIYYLFSLLGLILNIFLLDFFYWFYWVNYLFFVSISWIIFSIIHIFILFKYFNNPLKYTNINMGFIILLLILLWFTIFYNLFVFFPILFNIFYLFKFFQFKRFMNLEEWDKKDKYVKFVDKKQYIVVFITYWIFILSLIIFYFSYYSIPIVRFKQINDSYFENVYKYKDISDKDNWIFALEEYSNYIHNLKYIEDTTLFNNISKWWKIVDLDFNIEKVKKIDNLRLWLEKILSKKAIVDNYDDIFISLQWYSTVSRESMYNVLFYLENWKEIKAIDYLIDDYKLWNILITWYWNIIQFIVWLSIDSITLVELNYILDNYKLNIETLNYLKVNINNLENTNNSYKNIINYEYNNKLNLINTSEWFIKYNSIIFNDKNYLKEWLKNMYYLSTFKNNNMWRLCNKEKRDENLIKFFTKKNAVSRVQLIINCISFVWYDKDLKELQIKENNLLNKINLIIEKNKKEL